MYIITIIINTCITTIIKIYLNSYHDNVSRATINISLTELQYLQLTYVLSSIPRSLLWENDN